MLEFIIWLILYVDPQNIKWEFGVLINTILLYRYTEELSILAKLHNFHSRRYYVPCLQLHQQNVNLFKTRIRKTSHHSTQTLICVCTLRVSHTDVLTCGIHTSTLKALKISPQYLKSCGTQYTIIRNSLEFDSDCYTIKQLGWYGFKATNTIDLILISISVHLKLELNFPATINIIFYQIV